MGQQISKNFEIDKLIDDPLKIYQLSNQGKSIYVRNWNRTSPAAFIMSMQFRLVVRWMNNQQFYTIKKIKK